jgi:hypothetical protein
MASRASLIAGKFREADPEFHQVIQKMRKAQDSGYFNLCIEAGADKRAPDVLLTIQDKDIPPDLAEELTQMRKMLRLDLDVSEFKVVFGMFPQANYEIAIRTRSVYRIISYLSLNLQVPENHIAEGRAPSLGESCSTEQPELTVHSGCKSRVTGMPRFNTRATSSGSSKASSSRSGR